MEIEIKNFKKIKDNFYKLELADGNTLTLYADVILKYNLLLKKSIDSKLTNEILKMNDMALCYNKAIKYLSFKQRHKKEVIDYLKKNGFSNEIILNCVEKLEQQNYLNEETYIKAFINDQFNLTSSGPLKIKQKLLKLAIDEDLIGKYLNEIKETEWLNKLDNLIDKKILIYKRESKNKKYLKILMSCFNEGFNKDDIIKILETKELDSDKQVLEKEVNKLYLKYSKKYQGSELLYLIKGRLINKGYTSNEIDEYLNVLSNKKNL